MNHYEFSFEVALLEQYGIIDVEDSENTPVVSGPNDIIKWYEPERQITAVEHPEILNLSVTYDPILNCYKLIFDSTIDYNRAESIARRFIDPDKDGNYPVKSGGKTCLVSGELLYED